VLEGEGSDSQHEEEGGRWRGEGDLQHNKQHGKEPGNIRQGKKLLKWPRDLYVLWREFNVDLDREKAASDFPHSERGANCWYAYS
jgi:hypothetical protein